MAVITGEATLIDGKVTVKDKEYIDFLAQKGYGNPEEGSGLILSPEESLYLLGKEELKVKDGKGEAFSFKQLAGTFLAENHEVWVRYLIYRDLRSRGYVVKEGYGIGIDFRVYERGFYGKEAAKFIVVGVSEGKPIKVERILEDLRMTQSSKKELILAVVDRRGEVVYYTLAPLGF